MQRVALVLLLLFSQFTVAIPSSERFPAVPFREQILTCSTFLAPAAVARKTSVARRVGGHDAEEVKAGLRELRLHHPEMDLHGATLFITGVAMSDRAQVETQMDTLLSELNQEGFDLQYRILTVTDELAGKPDVPTLKRWWQKLNYFIPSLSRDYQTPTWDEFKSGFITTGIVEVPNAIYLGLTMPPEAAIPTLAIHTGLLLTFNVFKKWIVNWLLRPGINSPKEIFFKQVSLTVPWLLNYGLAGSYAGWMADPSTIAQSLSLSHIGSQTLQFTINQGPTVALQMWFYSYVITQGIRQWENSQAGDEDSETAKSVANYIAMPFLAADAVLLTMAGTGHFPILSVAPTTISFGPYISDPVGPVAITLGQVLLFGGTKYVGDYLKNNPKTFDPVLRWYKTKSE